jgi:hypothetical protein
MALRERRRSGPDRSERGKAAFSFVFLRAMPYHETAFSGNT